MTFDVYSVAEVMQLNGFPDCEETTQGRNIHWGCSITEDGTVTINPDSPFICLTETAIGEGMANLMHVSIALRLQHELIKVLIKSEDIEDAAQIILEEFGMLGVMLSFSDKETPARDTLPEYLPPRLMAILTRIVQIIRNEPRKPRARHPE
ncbi:MAG TPA: hypothetical protein VG269_15860 [Tepidisphaeraceae bacterium]|jgi:hypothetical protein|nr:hypothetical protein [Tepidisphaeraceae bacterium]